MRYFTIHLPKIIEHRLTEAQSNKTNIQQVLDSSKLVREGFNWEAFFLVTFWALRHRFWLGALGLTAVFTLLIYLPLIFGLDVGAHIILLVGFAFFCGFNANDLYRIALRKRDWKLVGIVGAKNMEQAYLRFERVLIHTENTFLKPTHSFPDNFRDGRISVDSSTNPNLWFFDN